MCWGNYTEPSARCNSGPRDLLHKQRSRSRSHLIDVINDVASSESGTPRKDSPSPQSIAITDETCDRKRSSSKRHRLYVATDQGYRCDDTSTSHQAPCDRVAGTFGCIEVFDRHVGPRQRCIVLCVGRRAIHIDRPAQALSVADHDGAARERDGGVRETWHFNVNGGGRRRAKSGRTNRDPFARRQIAACRRRVTLLDKRR